MTRYFIRVNDPKSLGGTPPGIVQRVLSKILPKANPDFERAYSQVAYWYLEVFDRKPVREIGFSEKGAPIVVGPYGRNYGLWADSPVLLDPANYPQVSAREFESTWHDFVRPHSPMMTRDEIVQNVGRERYLRECELARADAARSDYGRGPGADLEVPHEIESQIWDTDGSWEEKFDLLVQIYREMPCYGHLMYLNHNMLEFSAELRTQVWKWVERCLGETAISAPVAYWLWCDIFERGADQEGIDLSADAFTALTRPDVEEQVLKKVLQCSGPVTFHLKAQLYERLIPDESWHPWILESLLRSASDVYGHLDAASAKSFVNRLRVPSRADVLEEFGKALSSPTKKRFPATLADALRRESKERGGNAGGT